MATRRPVLRLIVAVLPLCAATLAAETRKEFSYAVGPRAVVSVTNDDGPITVRSSGAMRVVVNVVLRSDTANIEAQQNSNRIQLQTRTANGNKKEANRADYEVLIPSDACVILRSSTGPLRAEGVQGDLIFEGAAAPVNIADIRNAHVHVKTLNGSVTLTNIQATDLEVISASGNVDLRNVTGSAVSVQSGKGKITYGGDPGSGKYSLKTHSGDIEVSMPANASVHVAAHSLLGPVDHSFPFHPAARVGDLSGLGQGFVGSSDGSAASMVLHSFRGSISIRRQTSGAR